MEAERLEPPSPSGRRFVHSLVGPSMCHLPLCPVPYAAALPLYPSGDSSSQGPPPGHLTLPVVPLSASDDQLLFEMNVRLQYSDDERLLLPALLELDGCVGRDLPAEALLIRTSLLVRQTHTHRRPQGWTQRPPRTASAPAFLLHFLVSNCGPPPPTHRLQGAQRPPHFLSHSRYHLLCNAFLIDPNIKGCLSS